MKPIPDFETSFDAFFVDFVLRSLELREWVVDALGTRAKDLAFDLTAPLAEGRDTVRNLFEVFWRQVSADCRLNVDGTAVAPERIGYHPRFGWSLEAGNVRAHLGKVSLLEGTTVQIGNRSYISGAALVRGTNRLQIGAYTSIGEGFYANTYRDFHPMTHPSTYNFNENRRLREDGLALDVSYDFLDEEGAGITVGSDVWVGRNVRLSHDGAIGDGCIVAEGSLVRGKLEPYGIYGGMPARLIRWRFSDAIVEELLNIRWWTWSHDLIASNRRFFATDLSKFEGGISSLIDVWPTAEGKPGL